MAAVMSPTSPRKEVSGMMAAQTYADKRFNASAQELRDAGDRLWQYYAPTNEAFANGLRDGLYSISATR